MFAATCEVTGERYLIDPHSVVSIANTSAGIDVAYRCRCGALHLWHTGRVRASV